MRNWIKRQRKWLRLSLYTWKTDQGIVCFNLIGKDRVVLTNGRTNFQEMSLDEALEWAGKETTDG